MTMGETCVIQVTNIAPNATNEQMSTLFGFLGHVKEIVLYPPDDSPLQPTSRVCYVRYAEPWCVSVAQHLTNTVFVDRALIVLPVNDDKIPDATTALTLTNSGGGLCSGSNNGVVSQVVTGVGGAQVITTIDPRLTALGLPQYPPLPANMDPTKIEEIRRTVYVGNLDSTISAEQLLKFLNQIGEVKYVRMAGDETQPTRFAFVEFTDQSSVANALQYNGVIFGGRPLKINHSNNAIVKPQAKSSEAAQKEIEEAMKRVREAQSLISAAIEPGYLKFDKILEYAEKDKKRSRSRSRSKRSHSRSRDRRRSRSRARRSRSRERRKSRSRSREKRRSRERSPRRRSRSRARRSRRRSRSKERERIKTKRSKSRERTERISKRKHSRSRSRSRSKKVEDYDRLKEKERIKERLLQVEAQIAQMEPQPEGPELPPQPIHKRGSVSDNNDSDHKEHLSVSPLKYKDTSRSPRRSKSISPKRIKRRSPKRRSRSRGKDRSPVRTERHRKKRDRDRSRSRERYSKDKKRKRRERDESGERTSKDRSWIKRDYDEEEKGYDSDLQDIKKARKSVSPDD